MVFLKIFKIFIYIYIYIDKEPHLSKYKNWVTIPFIPRTSYKLRKILNKHGVGVHFSSGTTIVSILSKPKTPRPLSQKKNIVYKYTCECGKHYVGQTAQPFHKRHKQHMYDLKPTIDINDVKHATAKHQRCTGHMLRWDYPEIVACPKWRSQLNAYENIAIGQYKAAPPQGLNQDNGPKISPTWMALQNLCKFNPRQV